MDTLDLTPFWLSLRLAATTTLVLLVLGTPLAWWLARTRSRVRPVVEALVALPLVLPPTVLGFYLLLLLGPQGPLAPLLGALDLRLVFSFTGLVVGSVLFSAPFVVNPLKNAFEAIPAGQLEIAATLGAAPFDRFRSVVLPLAASGLVTAAVMGFAHTLGEFGVVLMIGGNIPGETQVLSIAIYDRVEQLDYRAAHLYSLGLVAFSLVILVALYASKRARELARP
ncbi:MAG: molybdate ABC transporter permease subunit [Gammaproteobacteria bacterium]|nr:molybdate ABC transporter permease subunit [Gammaproteobacteria bacterium]